MSTFLSNETIEEILKEVGWKFLIEKIKDGFREEAEGRMICPPKTVIKLNNDNDFREMPCYMKKYPDIIGCKEVCACGNNVRFGKPYVMGNYSLRETNYMERIIDAECRTLTAWRTAAASAAFVDEFNSEDKIYLGIIGCGEQSYYHLEAFSNIRDIVEVYVNDLNESKISDFIEHFNSSL